MARKDERSTRLRQAFDAAGAQHSTAQRRIQRKKSCTFFNVLGRFA